MAELEQARAHIAELEGGGPSPARGQRPDSDVVAAGAQRGGSQGSAGSRPRPPEELGHETERRYREIFESTRDGVVVVNAKGRITDANQAYCDMLGYSLEELRGMADLYQITPERWHEWELEEIWQNRLLKRGSSGSYEKEYIRKDGHVFPVELQAYAALGDDGQPLYLWGVVRNISHRKLGEERLQRLIQLQDSVIDDANVWLNVLDAKGNVVIWNKAAEKISGYTRDEVIGHGKIWEWCYPDESYRREITEKANAIIEECEVVENFETTIQTKTGHQRVVSWHSRNVVDDQGAPAGSIAIGRDITERKQAAEALRRSEEQFRFLAENMADIVWTMDHQLRTTYVSPSVEKVLGFTPEERKGQTLPEMLTPDSVQRVLESFQEELGRDGAPGLDKERTLAIEVEYIHADGHTVWMENRVNALRDDGGSIVGMYGSSRDITARKQSEEALRESEEKYRTLVDGSLQGVVIAQPDPVRLTFANPAMVALSGFDESELLDMGPEQLAGLIHPEDRPRFFANFKRRLEGEDLPARAEYRIVRKDGSVAWVQSYSSRIAFGGSPATLTAFVDETDRRRAEEEHKELEEKLQQAQKMEAIGRLAGGVAHDFNNVLCAITGNAALTLSDLSPDDPLRESLEEITTAAERAADLTRQLLAFSRKQVIEPKVVDLSRLIGGLHSMLVRLIGENINLRTVPQPQLGRVRVDPGQIEQVVLNLAINARDAMPDGGELLIEAGNVPLDPDRGESAAGAAARGHVAITVTDTGVGMDGETRSKIFEPFFTTKEQGQGTGLGLATVFGIVEQNGGTIEVLSEPGKGSSFKVCFPCVDEEAEKLAASNVPDPAGGQETVLVVEDEEIVRRLAVRLLSRHGYDVLAAGSPSDAMALSRRHEGQIDLLLTDVVMPGMNGRELATQLSLMRPGIKVLYTSGYTQDVIAHHGVLDEGVEFVAKPYSLDTLAARVREVLDQ